MPAAQVAVLLRLRLPRCAAPSPICLAAPSSALQRHLGAPLALLPAGSGPSCVAGGAGRGQLGWAAAPAAMASRKQRANVLIGRRAEASKLLYWPDEPADGEQELLVTEYKVVAALKAFQEHLILSDTAYSVLAKDVDVAPKLAPEPEPSVPGQLGPNPARRWASVTPAVRLYGWLVS